MLRQRHFQPVFAVSLFLLLTYVSVSFFRNSRMLYHGHDGQFFLCSFVNFAQWATAPFHGVWNPLQTATGFFSFDGYQIPGVYPFFLDIPLRAKVVASFAIFAAELFAAAYFLARTGGVGRLAAAASGWVVALLLYPTFFPGSAMGNIFLLSPLRGHATALSMFAMGALLRVRGLRERGAWGWGLCFIAAAVLLNASYMMAAAMAPTLLAGIVLIYFASENRSEVTGRLVISGLALLAMLASGSLVWNIAQVFSSARFVFNHEFLDVYPDPSFTSIIMQDFPYAKVVIPLGIVGGVLMLRDERRAMRLFAYYFLGIVTVVAVTSVLYYYQVGDLRKFFRPLYIEFTILPFYAMAMLYAVGAACRWLMARLSLRLPRRFPLYLALALSLFVAGHTVSTIAEARRPNAFRYAPLPRETVLVKRLRTELALAPGQAFRGRNVSLLWAGAYSDAEIARGLKPKFSFAAASPPEAVGNTHLESGLWFFDIPSLDGYDQSTTIPYYLMFSRCASATPWMFNHTCISRLNVPLFRASGIRFVLTPRQVETPGLTLAAYMLVKDGAVVAEAGAAAGEHPTPPDKDAEGYFLYETADANLCSYSPTTVEVASTYQQALSRLSRPDFDYQRRLLVFDADVPAQGLTPATVTRADVLRGGLRLQAAASGVSVLLLPFQYSHTMRWKSDDGSPQPLRIVRADMFMTAVFFDRRLSGELRLDAGFGPFRARHMADYMDIWKRKAQSVPRHDLLGDERYQR